MKKYFAEFKKRIDRHRRFLESKSAGNLLVYVNRYRLPWFDGFLHRKLAERPMIEWLKAGRIDKMIAEYATLLRKDRPQFFAIDDDAVPSVIVYWGIGGITSAMSGIDFFHDGTNSWLEPNLTWAAIEQLRFDPENPGLQFALQINNALWKIWEEDFLILPFLHRSPLDAANGLRGTELFTEMYSDPEPVKQLINWCADWSIKTEKFLEANVRHYGNIGTGAWGTWLPAGSVFVNGDPVGLISPEMQAEFDKPYTGKLFTATGGGFFHNHTLGLYQVMNVAGIPGILIQEFISDPTSPNVHEVMLNDPKRRDEIIQASLQTPVMMEFVPYHLLDQLLPFLAQGRFILSIFYSEDMSEDMADDAIRKVRSYGSLE
ncbi:MAG: hypothetical protein JXN60_04040 [Lentisphaerae bacterium]|nr:hypothetical protein [Lentisphaerota bacterium]